MTEVAPDSQPMADRRDEVIGLPSSREGGQGRELPLDALDVVPVRRDHGLGELGPALLERGELRDEPFEVDRPGRLAELTEPHPGHQLVVLAE